MTEQSINEKYDETFTRPIGTVFPTFFIGVGGCGSSIIMEIRKHLTARPDWKERYENLVHFMAFDTDKDDLAEMKGKAETFLISDFPKGQYVSLQTGREYKDENSFFTQWWSDWYATRPDSTKGAGQIRMESRLSLFYQLDEDRAGIVKRIDEAISRSKDHRNAFRAVRPAQANVHIFGSAAGGTGSGGMLTLGLLMQEQLRAARLSPVIVANVVLPTLFYRKVRHRLHDDIRSNGYAFLKEVEWFMTLGYNNNPRMLRGDVKNPLEDKIQFHYNPSTRDADNTQFVTQPPFDLVNIIDQPGDFAFSDPREIYPAIGSAAYVQLFSAIMGQRDSEEDNYYKKIKHLEDGFSLNFGTYGLSVLEVPDRAIADYCVARMGAVFAKDLVSGGSVSVDDYFERAFEEYQAAGGAKEAIKEGAALNILLDAGLLPALAELKKADDEKIADQLLNAFGSSWDSGFLPKFEEVRARISKVAGATAKKELREEMLLRGIDADAKKPWTNVRGEWDDRKKKFVDQYETGKRRMKAALEAEVKSGKDTLSAMIENTGTGDQKANLNPLSIQLALEYIGRKHKAKDVAERSLNFEGEAEVLANLEVWAPESAAEKAAKLIGKDIDDWKQAPQTIVEFFQGLVSTARSSAQKWAEGTALKELSDELEKKRDQGDSLKKIVENLPREFENQAKALIESDSAVGNYVLASEVLRGARTQNRYWDRLFDYMTDNKGYKQSQMNGILSDYIERDDLDYTADPIRLFGLKRRCLTAIRAAQKEAKKKKLDEETEVRRAVKAAIVAYCQEKAITAVVGERSAGSDRKKKGLMLDEALILEAKWELEWLFAADHLDNYGDIFTEEDRQIRRRELYSKWEPTDQKVDQYIKEKLTHLVDKSRVLARLRLTDSSAVDPFIFVALAADYDLNNGGMKCTSHSLKKMVQDSHELVRDARVLDNWIDEKRLVVYQGMAGLPVHNFWPINGELKDSYERVYREYVTGHDPQGKPTADFPSHIDTNFEDPNEWDPNTVLPSLEPGRALKKLADSDRLFYECLIFDHAHYFTINGLDQVEAGARAQVEMDRLIAKIDEQLGFPSAYVKEKITKQVKKIISSRLETDTDKVTWWFLNIPSETDDIDDDDWEAKILSEARPQQMELLGDRLDRALAYWSRNILRSGDAVDRSFTDRLTSRIKAGHAETSGQLNPEPFQRELLEKFLKPFQKERDLYKAKLQQGHRVKDLAGAYEDAVTHIREVYLSIGK